MVSNPYQMYKQQNVMTMTQGEMLTAVYDGMLKEMNFLKTAFAGRNYSEINERCKKIQVFLKHLQGSLDFKYEVSNNLNALYDYFIRVIIQANVKKDSSELDTVIQMVSELRESYIQADKKLRTAESGKSA